MFPFVVTNPTYTSIGVFTVLFMAATSAWNMFSGFSGYISLGHAVFYGTGAYTVALLASHFKMTGGYSVFALVPVAGVAAALIAIPFGVITLRTRRRTFIVITIAIFWLFQLSAYNFSFTGGAGGLLLPTPPWSGNFYNLPFYFVAFVLFAVAITLAWMVRHSRFGLQLLAIRDDEDRASALGVRVWPIKLTALVLSAFVTGMVGALWVYFVGPGLPPFRVRRDIRDQRHADGVLRRDRHAGGPGDRGAHPGIGSAVPRPPVLERVDLPGRVRRAVPRRAAVHAEGNRGRPSAAGGGRLAAATATGPTPQPMPPPPR